MPILDHLKKLKEQLTRRPHPSSGEPETNKVLYAIGVGMMALTTDNAIDESETTALKSLMASMNLSESLLSEVIAKATEGAENTILALVQSLQTPEQKDAFAFDLLAIMRVGNAPDADGREKLNLFLDLMKITPAERAFIASFSAAAATKSTPLADKALVEAYENGLQPDPKVFGYFFPELIAVGSGYPATGLRDFGTAITAENPFSSEEVYPPQPTRVPSEASSQTTPAPALRTPDSSVRWLGPSAADDGDSKKLP